MTARIDLAELRRLEHAATKGPWCFSSEVDGDPNRCRIDTGSPDEDGPPLEWTWDNASFVATMRDALPALLDLLDAVTRERDEARADGFRAGLEAAAKDLEADAASYQGTSDRTDRDRICPAWQVASGMVAACNSAARRIRALTPPKPEEP